MLKLLFHSLKETCTCSRNSLVFIVFFTTSIAWGNETTEGGDTIDLIGRMSGAAFNDGLNVTNELSCISDQSEAYSPFRHSLSQQNYLLLAPHLKKRFEEHKIGPLQRALFYSQIIHESQQFSRLSEVSAAGMQACWNGLEKQEGSACKNSLTCMILDDLAYREQKPYLETYRGRGLIHLTGCDTYISALHYHNTGDWRAWWPVDSAPPANCPAERCPEGQIGMSCTDENIRELKVWYKSFYGRDMDPTGVLDNVNRLSFTCEPSEPTKENPKNDFIANSSFAFWKGKCTDHNPAIPEALDILTDLGPI